jgi:HPt (histidine-containing phosphotransfer) domain-containing protein
MLDDILDMAKVEARKIDLEQVNFNLRETIGELTDMLRVTAETKGLKVEWSVAPEVPAMLRGDPRRLRQVLTSLATNALKFTSRGHVKLEATLTHLGDSAVTLRFSVSDTGIGIPPEQIAQLFHPFTQADSSASRKYRGAGIGLAISKQIVELMGGVIGAKSKQGVGSDFWFTAVFQRALPARVEPGNSTPNVKFNPDSLLDRLSGDRKLASVVLKAFLDDVPHQLYYLRQRWAQGDAAGVALRAHSLGQAAEAVAAAGLRGVAEALQRAGSTAQLDRCGELLPLAAVELERFQCAVESSGWL